MNNNQSYIKLLFEKHANREATPDEIRELFHLAAENNADEEFIKLLVAQIENTDITNHYDKALWDAVFAEIKSDTALIEEDIVFKKKRSFKTIRIGIAAAVALMVFGAGLFYYAGRNHKSGQATAYANDVSPGKVGATLTLADGKKIKLTDAANGELAKEAGIIISKAANGQIIYQIKENKQEPNKINTLTTAKGETYVLTLPDQSRVWLNANSSLTYAAALENKGLRSVKLTGEAYFEITKDKKHPFIVESKGQQVEVLGTHFNINSYSDEPVIKTTLLEGSVKVSSSLPGAITLKPNQQSTFSNNGLIKVQEANIEETMAWKNEYFSFNEEKIENIMRQLSRWYAIEVLYEGNIPAEKFNAKISRSKNISQILKALESTKLVHFKIQGRRVTVMGE